MSLEQIIWPMLCGIIVAIFFAVYNKMVLGAFVRKLLYEGVTTKENAKRLDETGFDKNPFVKIALSTNSSLRRVVYAVSDTADENGAQQGGVTPGGKKRKAKRVPVGELRFYVPEEEIDRAEILYSANGSNVVIALLSVIVFLILAALSFTVIPDLITMLNNFIGSL